MDDVYFSRIEYAAGFRDLAKPALSLLSVSCSNANVVYRLVRALSLGGTYSEMCDRRMWRVLSCSSSPVLCVDCSNACTSCPGSSFIINPCKSPCLGQLAAYNVIKFTISIKKLFPEYRSPLIVTALTRTTLQLVANLTTEGVIYCAAFAASTKGLTLTSVNMLKSLAKPVNVFSSLAGNIASFVTVLSVPYLSPNTNYTVYCYTEDFAGHGMDLPTVLENVVRVRTLCCPRVSFSSGNSINITSSIEAISSASSPLSSSDISTAISTVYALTLDAPPTAPLIVKLISSPCNGSLFPSDLFQSSLNSLSISPNVTYFTQKSNSLVGQFKINAAVPGCYVIWAIPSDTIDIFSRASVTVYVRDLRTPPSPPRCA